MSLAARISNYLSMNFLSNGTTVPVFGSAGYLPGHVFVNRVTGARYRNIGTIAYSMHVSEGINRHLLRENFTLRPGLNVNRDVPAADTYNTAQMQLGIDKNPHFEIVATGNAASADVTHSATGGIDVASHGAATDSTIIAPHTNSAVSAWTSNLWNTDREISYEALIVTDALIADETLWFGYKLTNTSVTATDNDQAFFRYAAATNSGKWQTVDSNNNTDNAEDSGVTVAVSTVYRLRIQVDGNRIPRYYINEALVNEGLALKTNTSLVPFAGVLSAVSATAKVFTLRSLTCGMSYA